MPRKPPELGAGKPTVEPELVSDLQRLGFSEYEARTYLSLLRTQPATAYEISKQSGLPRANTYGALENLTKKRAVQPISENPVKYAPIDPSTLLDRVASDVGSVCGRLKERLARIDVGEQTDVVWNISGQEQIERKIDELIAGAHRHVWIKASTEVLHRHTRQLERAAARGVELVFVVFGQDVAFLNFGPKCRVYLHEGNGIRMGGADNLFTITSDYRIALTANVTDELTGAYTTNESVLRMAETLIRHDFYMAEIMSRFGAEIESAFGARLVSLRRQMFSQDQYRLLESRMEVERQARIADGGVPGRHGASAEPAPGRRTVARTAPAKTPSLSRRPVGE